MSLFKRRHKTGELGGPQVQAESWKNRITRVGIAIDSLQEEARDVVIVTEGDESDRGEVVSLLAYRQSTYIAVWTSLMYRLSADRDAPSFVNERGEAPLTTKTPKSDWQKQLRGVGVLLDEIPRRLNSPAIVVLPSGVVINTLAAKDEWPPEYKLRSFAFSNEQVAEALARDTLAQELAAKNIARH